MSGAHTNLEAVDMHITPVAPLPLPVGEHYDDDKKALEDGVDGEGIQPAMLAPVMSRGEDMPEGATTTRWEEWAYVRRPLSSLPSPHTHPSQPQAQLTYPVPVLQRRLWRRAQLVLCDFVPVPPHRRGARPRDGRAVRLRAVRDQLGRGEAGLVRRLDRQWDLVWHHDAAVYHDWVVCRLWAVEQVDLDRLYRCVPRCFCSPSCGVVSGGVVCLV